MDWLTQALPMHEGVGYGTDPDDNPMPESTRIAGVGSVRIPSGTLAVGDIGLVSPLPHGGSTPDLVRITVPPGRYTVYATCFTHTYPSGATREFTSAASVRLADAEPTSREVLRAAEGGHPPDGAEPHRVSIDGAACSFVDAAALDHDVRAETVWEDYVYDHLAGRALPWTEKLPGGGDLVGVESGVGDGRYPVFADYDSDGGLVAVHVDFLMLRRDQTPGDH